MQTDLLVIPGIGVKIKNDLIQIGYESVESLRNNNPEFLYEKLCVMKGHIVDRCVLYVIRCAVYFASNKIKDPEKLKWYNWKDCR